MTRFEWMIATLLVGKTTVLTRKQRGFTLIELVVSISIIVFLAGMLLQRIWFYQEQAEKAAMEQVAAAVQSALILQYAHLMTNGREADAAKLLTENPLNWLMRKPPNYAGEFFAPARESIPAGNWTFDLNSHELIYVPSRTDYFTPGKDGYKWVRYRVHLEYASAPLANVGKNRDTGELSTIVFEPTAPYQWMIQG